ncbi:hypothetical protein BU16DRAFT_238505 [Lophium mytilinum]|uniref:Sialidase n=1 Tax=Lophium mytilinum TaxID=390894 RepID=A0A6A6R720_9PEZI|nr:hypothetical protein BU16DRAFT_238505 [Lophium mytilinum]
MYSRQTTPPSATFAYIPNSAHSRNSSDGTYMSHDSSPDSVNTSSTTPPRSPIRQHGPLLLPKVRPQDQITEPTGGPVRHRRTTSNTSIGYASTFNPYSRPQSLIRRATSPPNNGLDSPASTVASPYDVAFHSALNSPITFTPSSRRPSMVAHGRSHSASAIRGHARSSSAGSVDESVIGRFGYPTYRQMPSYVTASSAAPPALNLVTALPTTYPSEVHEVSHMSRTISSEYSVTDFSPAPAVQYPLAAELQYEMFTQPTQTTTLLEYLTGSNPSPALVRRITSPPRGIHTHFWWDIRNLRSWTDFNIQTISAVPGFLSLLSVDVPSTALPTPTRPNMQPETESQLHDLCRDYYAAKVNAALKVSQGNTHMMMRATPSPPGSRQQPEFVSNYLSDYEKTIFGDGRGRVVGLVKAYDQWNTGMRSEAPNKQVHYLQGLAQLHRVMREHGCRYGFILTEIELLVVRCGGPSSATTPDPTTVNANAAVPIFGYLELSAPIRLSTHGVHPETGSLQMTAGLALWYLHMLAKENPLPGMSGSWRMDVGGPAALSRQNCLEKDAWVPKPNLSEKREAKRLRGWVMPEEPLSRKECGRGKRARSRG